MKRIELSTGVTLNVAVEGDPAAPAVILLHGFPESHRTWREVWPHLSDRYFLVMPDQRGFGASDRPQDVESYKTETLIADVFALAEALDIASFALVGHDWGGAIAWPAALRNDPRLTRLGIVNAPHPLLFQKSVIADPAQRAASQYITAFRTPGFEQAVEAMGFETFFEKSFRNHVDLALIPDEERWQYIDQWSRPGALTAMLNWYRASRIVVPAPGAAQSPPDWTLGEFPKIHVPTLVVWGMKDKALLPVQLNGLDALIDNLRIVRLPDAGHFAPWEAPFAVGDALRDFLA
jgi:pimeloyl-ACP methyl ester carboxylesterase